MKRVCGIAASVCPASQTSAAEARAEKMDDKETGRRVSN